MFKQNLLATILISSLFVIGVGGIFIFSSCRHSDENQNSHMNMHQSNHINHMKKNHFNQNSQNNMMKKSAQNINKEVLNGFEYKPTIGTKAWCPVMKNDFTVNKNTPMVKYNGKYYAFCCGGCKPQFEKNPQKFIKKLKNHI